MLEATLEKKEVDLQMSPAMNVRLNHIYSYHEGFPVFLKQHWEWQVYFKTRLILNAVNIWSSLPTKNMLTELYQTMGVEPNSAVGNICYFIRFFY